MQEIAKCQWYKGGAKDERWRKTMFRIIVILSLLILPLSSYAASSVAVGVVAGVAAGAVAAQVASEEQRQTDNINIAICQTKETKQQIQDCLLKYQSDQDAENKENLKIFLIIFGLLIIGLIGLCIYLNNY